MKQITLPEILAANTNHCINPFTGVYDSGGESGRKTLPEDWEGTIIEAFDLLDDWEPERLIGVISWNDWLSTDDFLLICNEVKKRLDASFHERVSLLIGYIENEYRVRNSALLILGMAKSNIGKQETFDLILSLDYK